MKNLARTIFVVFVFASASAVAFASPSGPPKKSQKTGKTAGPTPVLVELFTSEGCSDCPPADKFLRALATLQLIPGAEIIPIEEHVTYWNHQGWFDPYSSEQWTQRQDAYARVFGQKQVYSPEMVVDGTSGFPGDNATAAEMAIQLAADQPGTAVSIHLGKLDPGRSVQAEVAVGRIVGDKFGDSVEIWLGVTEGGLMNSVTAGENKGRVLHQEAVLRSLQKIGVVKPGSGPESFEGDPAVKLDSHWKIKNLRLIVFLQDQKTLRILGAASAPVSQ